MLSPNVMDIVKTRQLEMGFKVADKPLPGQFNFSVPDLQSDALRIGLKGSAELIPRARWICRNVTISRKKEGRS